MWEAPVSVTAERIASEHAIRQANPEPYNHRVSALEGLLCGWMLCRSVIYWLYCFRSEAAEIVVSAGQKVNSTLLIIMPPHQHRSHKRSRLGNSFPSSPLPDKYLSAHTLSGNRKEFPEILLSNRLVGMSLLSLLINSNLFLSMSCLNPMQFMGLAPEFLPLGVVCRLRINLTPSIRRHYSSSWRGRTVSL